eukprot:TRINITY_DN24445_c0_g1_i1.p1 TRINITY_DN24445_c0_g1~~TRINITY_DN24445_c0_g1_i1.p1  ORF type:complete len:296 (+),score=62.47 TRINITY_DN24445_c0_g1_i1:46-888(+)
MVAEGLEEEVSTIFIAGFPSDASSRELDNFCRFLPGFLNSKATFGKGITLFALFDSAMNAQAAIEVLKDQAFDRFSEGEPLRVVMARSNMRNVAPSTTDRSGHRGGGYSNSAGHASSSGYGNSGGYSSNDYASNGYGDRAPRSQPPPPSTPYPGNRAYPPAQRAPPAERQYAPPAERRWSYGQAASAPSQPVSGKRARHSEDPSSVDTVASVGAADAGIDEEHLHSFFAQLPGFVVFKGNPRMGGGFAKFQTPQMASEAIRAAEAEGIPAARARSSMSDV